MADVIVSWDPNPAVEQISAYAVYLDGNRVAPATSPHTLSNVLPGVHAVEIAAIGQWGEGPHSDQVVTPPGATKPGGVRLLIQVAV